MFSWINDNMRDYQTMAVQQVVAKHKNGLKDQLIELPTGCGKTVIAGAIACEYFDDSSRILFITHREEIINQTAITFEDITDSYIGIVKAVRNEYDMPIVLCSIQSLASKSRKEKVINHSPISVVIIDECHHWSENNSYGKVLDAIRESWPDVLMVGMSATPYRNDAVRITDKFEPVFSRSIERMQKDGWLAKHKWERITIDEMLIDSLPKTSISGERDFRLDDLAHEVEYHLDTIAETSSQLIGNRQTVVFACNIDHMHTLVDLYYYNGINAGAIWGDMPKQDREDILNEWRNGKIQVVVNVGVLTEGFDYPGITAVVMARPTMSPSLYVQMIGRGLRTIEGKEDCLIVDYTGRPSLAESGFTNTWKPVQTTLPDILGKRNPGEHEDNHQLHERRIRTFKSWSGLPFSYIPEMDSYVMSAMVDRMTYTFVIVYNSVTGLYIPGQIKNNTIEPLANGTILRSAIAFMDKYLSWIGVHRAFLSTKAQWRKALPSDSQINYLKRLSNEPIPGDWLKGEIADQITILTSMNAIRQFLGIPDVAKLERKRKAREALIAKGVISNSTERKKADG